MYAIQVLNNTAIWPNLTKDALYFSSILLYSLCPPVLDGWINTASLLVANNKSDLTLSGRVLRQQCSGLSNLYSELTIITPRVRGISTLCRIKRAVMDRVSDSPSDLENAVSSRPIVFLTGERISISLGCKQPI